MHVPCCRTSLLPLLCNYHLIFLLYRRSVPLKHSGNFRQPDTHPSALRAADRKLVKAATLSTYQTSKLRHILLARATKTSYGDTRKTALSGFVGLFDSVLFLCPLAGAPRRSDQVEEVGRKYHSQLCRS